MPGDVPWESGMLLIADGGTLLKESFYSRSGSTTQNASYVD